MKDVFEKNMNQMHRGCCQQKHSFLGNLVQELFVSLIMYLTNVWIIASELIKGLFYRFQLHEVSKRVVALN